MPRVLDTPVPSRGSRRLRWMASSQGGSSPGREQSSPTSPMTTHYSPGGAAPIPIPIPRARGRGHRAESTEKWTAGPTRAPRSRSRCREAGSRYSLARRSASEVHPARWVRPLRARCMLVQLFEWGRISRRSCEPSRCSAPTCMPTITRASATPGRSHRASGRCQAPDRRHRLDRVGPGRP